MDAQSPWSASALVLLGLVDVVIPIEAVLDMRVVS